MAADDRTSTGRQDLANREYGRLLSQGSTVLREDRTALVAFGLKQVLGDAADNKVADFLDNHFKDHAGALPKALARAHDRAWDALGVALAGDGFFDQIKRFFADAKGLREQVRVFLATNTFDFAGATADFKRHCLTEQKAAAARNESYDTYLLRLTELEVASRSANTIADRIRAAGFPALKDFDTFDFTATPNLPRAEDPGAGPKRSNRPALQLFCLVGWSGTGKTHVAIALGLEFCRLGKREVHHRCEMVTLLEVDQQQHRLDRLLASFDCFDPLIVDELGYLSFSRAGAELLFQVFADRYERRSLLITSNLPFGEWGPRFQGERMTAALLDRLTHQCHIFEMNGESYRFRESMMTKKDNDAKKAK